MATLRSGKKLDANANTEEDFDEKKKGSIKKDRTTLVVFFGLLIDLLGKMSYSLQGVLTLIMIYFQLLR